MVNESFDPGIVGENVTAEALAKTKYYPTILIGLGGTGTEVLLRVKKLILERMGSTGLHRFVFIDNDESAFRDRGMGLPSVGTGERCVIGEADRVQAYLGKPNLHKELYTRFPKESIKEQYIRALSRGQGAGQIRAVGAIAFSLNYDQVNRAISTAFINVTTIDEKTKTEVRQGGANIGKKVYVYIVCSLNGGTGAGCFLDTALTAREVCGPEAAIIGIFALPSPSFDKINVGHQAMNNRMRANAYAALKELQFVIDGGRSKDFSVSYSSVNKITLPGDDPLFSLVYLVDDRNPYGRLTDLNDLYELMARSIFMDVGSPFGANAQSAEVNNPAVTRTELCPETGLPRILGTVSTATLAFPAHRIAYYCVYRIFGEVIGDRLQGVTLPTAAIEASVGNFLRMNNLDDRGRSNQILEGLLGQRFSPGKYRLPVTWGAKYSYDEFTKKIQAEWGKYEQDRQAVDKQVKDSLEQITGGSKGGYPKLNGLVEEFGLGVASAQGGNSAGTIRHLEVLQGIADSMKAELDQEQTKWRTQEKPRIEDDLNKLCAKKIGLIDKAFGDEEKRSKESLIRVLNDRVENDLWALAKPAASTLLEKFSKIIGNHIDRWKSLDADLGELRKEVQDEYRRRETHAGLSTESRFAVEQEVTWPGYEQEYFETYVGQRVDEAFSLICDSFRKGEGTVGVLELYRWMTRLSPKERKGEILRNFGQTLLDHYGKGPLGTDVVEFITGQSERMGGGLDVKLDTTFEACQPFWDITPVKAGQEMYEYNALCVRHIMTRDKEGGPIEAVVPAPVKRWLEEHVPAKDKDKYAVIPGAVPYEIILGRRVYGARAYYLTNAEKWKIIYETLKKQAQGNYMFESHAALASIPDLFPDRNEALEPFAIGLALGFIATRGDWYYFVLERTSDGKVRVKYSSQAKTVRSLSAGEGTKPSPQSVGDTVFEENPADKIPVSLRLAQGREKSLEKLGAKPEWLKLMNEAIDDYHQTAGNERFKTELEAYRTEVLETQTEAGSTFNRELQAINRRIARIGK